MHGFGVSVYTVTSPGENTRGYLFPSYNGVVAAMNTCLYKKRFAHKEYNLLDTC